MRKGLDVLVEAYASRLAETCAMDIVTAKGAIPAELARTIQRLPNVTVHHDASSKARRSTSFPTPSDALVLPTRLDLSSLTALERWPRRPVIATPVGILEIIVDGDRLIVEIDNPAALADAIERVRTDSDLRKRVVSQALHHVETHFDAAKNTDGLLAALKRL